MPWMETILDVSARPNDLDTVLMVDGVRGGIAIGESRQDKFKSDQFSPSCQRAPQLVACTCKMSDLAALATPLTTTAEGVEWGLGLEAR